jgi:ribulose-phosphate 3-epimerase
MKKLLAPSILSADLASLTQQIRYAEMGGADWIHCDIMDGHFVPNISFGPIIVEAAKRSTRLPLDVHLMIENPDKYIKEFIEAGAAYVTIHQEAVIHLNRTVDFIRDNGSKSGVSINPSTSVETLTEILPFVDLVLLMSVNPGFGGQKFIDNSLMKISKLKRMREELKLNFLIEVDGGVSAKNIKNISEAGCDVFVAGSSIFKSDNITAAAAELKTLISE